MKGANDRGHERSVLYEATTVRADLIGMQEKRRAGRTCFTAAESICSSAMDLKQVGSTGWIAVKESTSHNFAYTIEYVGERLAAIQFEMIGQSGAVNFETKYAPT